MSGSLWERFPGVANVRERITVYPLKAKFTAALIGGRYVFSAATAKADLFKISQGQMGIIDGISFVSNVDQLTFSNAIDPNVNDGFFKMNVNRKGNNHPINLAPFYFASFSQSSEFTSVFLPTAVNNGQEEIELVIDGALLQTPEIISLGKAVVTMQATINFFHCRDTLK